MNKRLLAVGLMLVFSVNQAKEQSFLRTFKKKVLDFSPVSTFWHVTPYERWVDQNDTIKNRVMRIVAVSLERSLCPSVGTVAKGYAIEKTAHALGTDTEYFHYGPVVVDGQNLSYYMINFMYNVTFSEGDLGQRVAYTLYKMCIRKECARFVYRHIAQALSYLKVSKVLDYCLCSFIKKKPYRIVLTDVVKRAVTTGIEEIIDESFGKPHVFPLIYGDELRTR